MSTYVTNNTFSPASATGSLMGRSVENYTQDVLRQLYASKPSPTGELRQQAYERASNNPELSNPAFNFGAAGRLVDPYTTSSGDPRVLRGYIRRSVVEAKDPTSKYRLYFMFNPAGVNRQFVSYLDQQALDPFNTIFGSKNLVAPPGVLDFSFEMFFDRHSEVAQDASHPGVKVDYDFFDRVVRGVEPSVNSGNEMQDNGVFLINPRNIKVVFSPLLVLEGRAYSADVVFEKFSHRMTPTRVRINLTMRVLYVGPDTDSFSTFNVDDAGVYQATVPYEQSIDVKTTIKNVYDSLTLESDQASSAAEAATAASSQGATTAAGVVGGGAPVAGNGNAGFIWPVKTGFVSQEFGVNGHPGMDIAAAGGTPIYAVKDGIVKGCQTVAQSGGYGNICRVEHVPGGLSTGYAHQPSLMVRDGDVVKQGQQIGTVGTTGNSTGNHLHFEVYSDGGGAKPMGHVNQNPRNYLPPGGPS